jgi:multidrug efflux system membrane fusion protein
MTAAHRIITGRRAATVALALTTAVASLSCQKEEGHTTGAAAISMERPPAPVSVAAAITRDVPVYLDQIGKTVAVEVVSIIPQVGGKIVAAHVNDGDYVKKGQLLFEIDPRPLKAALAQAKAALAQAKADAELAKSEFNRIQKAVETNANAVAQMEFDQKQSAVAVADARIEAAQAAVETAQLNLEYANVFSPIDGRAGARLVDPGNVVKENDKSLLVVQRLDPIYAEFTITENDLGTVRKYLASRGLDFADRERGLRCLVDIPGNSDRVLAALGANNPTTAPTAGAPSSQPTTRSTAGPREGQLTFLDNSVQDGTGTVRLRATLPNADRYFWPGQFINVRLILTTKKDAVLIPSLAQQIGQQGPFVYVAKDITDKDGKPATIAEIRPITPGQRQGDMIVIDSGLAPGDKVVVVGQMMIMPGGKVQIVPTAPAPGADPAQTADAH